MMKDLFGTLRFLPLLQEDGSGGGGNNSGTAPDGAGNNSGIDSHSSTSTEEGKTFTQGDLNRIAAQEKRQGMVSMLKALGFEKEEDAKAFVEKYRKEENEKKDDLTKAQGELTTANSEKSKAEERAEMLERKLKAVSAGVPAKNVDDIVLLAAAKTTDGKTFDDALEEVKKAYPMLFAETGGPAGESGTGGSVNGARARKHTSESGIGKRLAEQKRASSKSQKKQVYFSN